MKYFRNWKSIPKNANDQQPMLFERLEDRVLFDAVPDATLDPAADDAAGNDQANALRFDTSVFAEDVRTVADTQLTSDETTAEVTASHELVIVDASVDDYQQLVDDILNAGDNGRAIDVVTLDGSFDGVSQIRDILSGYTNLDALHLVAHGEDGGLQLGNTWLSNDNLGGYAAEIAAWSTAFAENGDILLLGCDVASSSEGRELVQSISTLTGTDVAASSDDTGYAPRGGDWDLEFVIGQMETSIAFSSDVQASWQHLLAPGPTVTMDVPDSAFLGETFNFTVTFDNTGSDPDGTGYGPFIDLLFPANGADGAAGTSTPDGLEFLGATYLGSSINSQEFTFPDDGGGTGTIDHPYAVDNTDTPLQVTGTAGDKLIVLQLPFGSIVAGQPSIAINVEAQVSSFADPYDVAAPETELTVRARAGFQYGADALDNPASDPSLLSDTQTDSSAWVVSDSLQPELLDSEKIYNGPEDETATGPNFVRSYTINAYLAQGQTLNDLTFTDLLPNTLEYVPGTLVVTSGGSTLTSGDYTILEEPAAPGAQNSPDNDLVVRIDQAVVGAGPDTAAATLTFDFFVPLNDADGSAIIDPSSGDDHVVHNDSAITGSWLATDTRDQPAVNVESDVTTQDHSLEQQSIAIQKGIALGNDTGSVGVTPGDSLEYTLDFQVSDFFAFDDVQIVDTFSDGQDWYSDSPTDSAEVMIPTLEFTEHGVVVATADFSAANYSVVENADGTTTVTFNVSQELIDRAIADGDPTPSTAGELLGGWIPQGGTGSGQPDGSFNAGATTGRIVYRTQVLEDYKNGTGIDSSVDQGDTLDNAVTIDGAVLNVDDLSTYGTREADDSAAGIEIATGDLTKYIYAVNGDTNWAPFYDTDGDGNPNVVSGDLITYRIEYELPTSDVEDFELVDYLPLPVFDSTGVSMTRLSTSDTPPGENEWRLHTDDTFTTFFESNATAGDSFGSSTTVEIVSDSNTNSFRVQYGTVDDPVSTARKIDLLITVPITSQPAADGLFYTNQTQTIESNTFGGQTINQVISQQDVQVFMPVLNIRKGIVDSTDTTAFAGTDGANTVTFTETTATADFSGSINSDWLDAVNLDTNISDLDAGDTARFAIVVENTGGSRTGAFDLTVSDLLPAGLSYVASSLQIYDGTGAALTYTLPDGSAATDADLFTSGLRIEDPGATAGGIERTDAGALDNFDTTDAQNIAVLIYDVTIDATALPATQLNNTASIDHYASIEGGENFVDTPETAEAGVTVANVSATKTIVGTSESHTGETSGTERVTIGEIVRYRIELEIPEGTSPHLTLRDKLPAGLTFIDDGTATIALVSDSGTMSSSTLSGASLNVAGDETTVSGITPTFVLPDSAISENNDPGVETDTWQTSNDPHFKLGDIVNDDRDSDSEFVVIEFNALVDNNSTGSQNDIDEARRNDLEVLIDSDGNGTIETSEEIFDLHDRPLVRIVEPVISNFDKSVDLPTGDAADIVTYTVTFDVNSGDTFSDAFDVRLQDDLPAGELTLVGGSLTVQVDATTLTAGVDFTDNSSGNSIDFVIDRLVEGESVTVTYQATVDTSVAPTDILTNRANLTWTSLPGEFGTADGSGGNATGSDLASLNDLDTSGDGTPEYNTASGEGQGERDGSGQNDPATAADDTAPNSYFSTDTADVTIDGSSLTKTLVGTNIDDSAGAGNNVANEAVIGEIVTYTITLDVNEAIIPNAQLVDTLDAGLVFVGVTGSSVNNVTLDGSVDLLNPTVSANGEVITWDLQTITDTASADNGGAGDSDGQITITYEAIVTNVIDTQAGDTLNNSVAFQWDDDPGTAPNPRESINAEAAVVTIIEPELTVTKTAALDTDGDTFYDDGKTGDAGDAVQFTITLTNNSGVDAFDIDFSDVLPTLGDGSSVVLNATLFSVTDTSTTGAVSAADFEIVGTNASGFTLQNVSSSNIDMLASQEDSGSAPRVITLVVQGTIASGVSPNLSIDSAASVQWTSIDGVLADTSSYTTDDTKRTGSDGAGASNLNNYQDSASDAVTISPATFTKSLFATDQTETSGTDVTIGETVTYALLVTLPEGVIPDTTVLDQLPDGLNYSNFQIVTTTAASIDYLGTQLLANDFNGTIVPTDPTVSGGASDGDDVTFSFGSIDVTVDNNGANNSFLILVDAVVSDVATNTGYAGNQQTLSNTATIDFSFDSELPLASNTVNVTVVEPNLVITKEFGPIVDTDMADAGDVLTVNLTVDNSTGTSAAYDVVVRDILAATDFDHSTVDLGTAGVDYPADFTASFTTGTGLLQYSGGTIAAGDSVTFSFTVELTETVNPGATITNTATVTDASTLSGTVTGERSTPDADGDGSDTDNDTVTIRSNSLAGIVWDDTDNDGTIDALENGIAGVDIRLQGTDHLGNSVDTTIQTLADGSYLFDDLRPGVYSITQDPAGNSIPAGYLDGQDNIGTQGGNASVNDLFSALSLAAGTETDGTANNFAEIQASSLSGAVYHDADNDGIFDGTEVGIDGVQIRLTGTDDLGNTVDITVATSGGGLYSFANLRPDNGAGYTLTEFADPSGYLDGLDTDGSLANGNTSVNNAISSIDIVPGDSGTDYNFGEIVPSTLSGYVYHDADNDGDRADESAGSGIQNSQIRLTGTDDVGNTVDVTVNTDADGYYEFTGLRPDNGSGYTLTQISVPAGYLDGVDTVGTPGGNDSVNDVFSAITVTSDTTGTENNFGELLPASLSGRVFNDYDADGAFDAADGEVGITNVAVRLTGTDDLGNSVDVTVNTDADGNYSFTNLRPSDATGYTITETHPAAYNDGIDSDGSLANGNTTANDVISSINVVSGDSGTDYTFAETGAAITGTVFVDDNRDGDLDGDESVRIGGVTVELFDISDPLNPVSLGTTTTAADGTYLFENLPAGDYRVVQTQPTQYANVSANSLDITLTTAGSTNNDFGEALMDLGDTVYFDANNNGVQDAGEEGLANVDVTLQYAGANGIFGDFDDPAPVVVTTDANGAYSFTELFNGQYTITIDSADLPAGMTGTDETDDSSAAIDGIANITISDADRFDVDFGYTGALSVGDTFWFDADGDGTRSLIDTDGDGADDTIEPGLSGVTVELTFAGADGNFTTTDDNLTLSTITAADGSYSFDNLPPGEYQIAYTAGDIPGGLTASVETDDSSAATDGVANITLSTNRTDVDFGFVGDHSIGDIVWFDIDGDGTRNQYDSNADSVADTDEPLFANVDVTVVWAGFDGLLSTSADNVVFTTTTDAVTGYLVNGLPDGNFQVSLDLSDLPAGMSQTYEVDSTSDNSANVAISGSDRLDVDFGFRGTASMSDQLWHDVNADGVFNQFDSDGDGTVDTQEPVFSGIDITAVFGGQNGIIGDGDDFSLTTQTAADGTYSFNNLPAGNYEVIVDTTDLPAGFANSYDRDEFTGTANDNRANVILASGETDSAVDFGYVGTGSLGDRIWHDVNGDGVQDADEPGLANVAIDLLFAGDDGVFGTTDDLSLATSTDSNGLYSFDQLPAGDYRIDVNETTVPGSYTQTFVGEDAGGTISSVAEVALSDGQTRTDVDFGYAGTLTVGDFVWYDANADRVQNAGEPGLGGIGVSLIFAGPDADFLATTDDVTLTTTTDANGFYSFSGLFDGDYRVIITSSDLPAGATATFDQDDAAFGAPILDHTANIALASTSRADADFGYRGTGSIGDLIYFDKNNNGSFDGDDRGLPGIDVTANIDLDGDSITDYTVTQTTDINGGYLFENLLPGTWTVTVDTADLPPGMASGQTADPDATLDHTTEVILAAGEDNATTDFGYNSTATLGDFVWLDSNGDGVQDATNEPGLAGVDISLIWAGADDTFGTSDDETFSTTTANDGSYLFEFLPGGEYQIDVDESTAPGNTLLTTANDGQFITLSVGDDVDTLDFGFVGGASGEPGAGAIGDYVFYDFNGDGIENGDDVPFAGLVVTLTADIDNDGTDETFTTTTDNTGRYEFVGLPFGDYTVTLTPPAGTTASFDNDGHVVSPNSSQVTLDAANPGSNVQDFGLTGLGRVQDTVFFDLNDDGSMDSGEPGIPGVTVTIDIDLDGDGSFDFTSETITDQDGNYSFENLPEGTVTLTVTTPEGTNPTSDLDGDNTADTSGDANVPHAGTGEPGDMGFIGTGSIGDTVFWDADRNGLQGTNEPGLSGISVALQIDFNGDDVVDHILTTTTDAAGNYHFDELPAASYTVVVEQIGLSSTYDADGISTAGTSSLSLAAGEDNTAQDFGFVGTGTLTDIVFFDIDNDGTDDTPSGADRGLPDVDVTLTIDINGDGLVDYTESTTTDSDGLFIFTDLIPGTYTVTTDPSDMPPGLANNPTVDNDGTITPHDADYVLPPNTIADGSGFGFHATPDYEITKTTTAVSVQPGDTIQYTIRVRNIGELDGRNVTVTDNFPAELLGISDASGGTVDNTNGIISWDIPALEPGEEMILVVTADVFDPVVAGYQEMTNIVSVTDDGYNGADPDLDNNSSEVITPLDAAPDYVITVTDDLDDVHPGNSVTYTITVTNDGDQHGSGVVVTSQLKPELMQIVTPGEGGTYDEVSGVVTWNLGQLDVGETVILTIEAKITNPVSLEYEHTCNTAIVDDDHTGGADPTPENNIAEDTTDLPEFAFDSFTDLSGGDKDLEAFNTAGVVLPAADDPYKHRMRPIPVDTVYTGIVDPGTTLSGKIYDSSGRLVGEQIVVADGAGNWLMQFPTVVLYEQPHEMRIDQTMAVQNGNYDAGFNLRRFFHPAVHGQLYMNEPLSVSAAFHQSPDNVLSAMHAANNNPLSIDWNHHSYELIVSSSNTAAK